MLQSLFRQQCPPPRRTSSFLSSEAKWKERQQKCHWCRT